MLVQPILVVRTLETCSQLFEEKQSISTRLAPRFPRMHIIHGFINFQKAIHNKSAGFARDVMT